MATADLPAPTTTDLPATSHLSLDAKRQLLLRIARELMDPSGTASATDAAGEVVVYAIPANDPARKAELAARLQRLHTAVPLTEVIADLKQRASRPQTPQSSPCATTGETTAASP